MSLTYLSQEEKLRSLIYVSNHDLSSDINIQNKQYEILRIFWNNYIKECDYFPYVRILKYENYKVYTFDWDTSLTIEECDRLIKEFSYRNEKYIMITKVLINELSKVNYPSLFQLKLVNGFTEIFENWMIKDPEEYVDMFNSKYYLNNLFSEYNHRRLIY